MVVPQIIHFNTIFHYASTNFWGNFLHFRKPPH